MAPGKDKLTGIGLAILSTLLWSVNFIIARGLHDAISPVSLAFFRWAVATITLAPFALKLFSKDWPVIRANFTVIVFTAFFGITLFNTLVYVAGHYTSAINLAIIGTTASPVFVLLIGAIFFKNKIEFTQLAGTIICIAGILVLISRGNWHQLNHFKLTAGDLWILAAALAFAIYTSLIKFKPANISSISYLFSLFLFGTIILIPVFLFQTSGTGSFKLTMQMLWVFIYLGIGTSVIAFLCWNMAIKKIGSAPTAFFGNLIPAFSTIEAVLLLNEKFSLVAVISIGIIFCGIIIGNSKILFKQIN